MNGIKSYVFSVCILCVMGCVCTFLMSGHSVSKPVTALLSLIILITLLQPIISDNSYMLTHEYLKLFDNTRDYTVNEEIYEQIMKTETETQIRTDVARIVERCSENKYEIMIDMDISKDRCIDIKRITVVLYSESIPEQLVDELKQYHTLCNAVTAKELKYEDE